MSKRTWWCVCSALMFMSTAISLGACGLLADATGSAEAAQAAGDTVGSAVALGTGNPIAGYAAAAVTTAVLGAFAAFKAKKAQPTP